MKATKERKPRTTPPEQIGVLRAWYPKYREAKAKGDKSVNQDTVHDATGYAKNTIRKYFKKWELEDLKEDEKGKAALKAAPGATTPVIELTPEGETAKEAIRQQALQAIANESTKVINTAIALGSLLATKYRPIIEVLESKDKGPEDIVMEIMGWYEMKPEKEKELAKKNFTIMVLTQKIKELSEMTYPVYWAEVKSNLFYKHAKDLVLGRLRGMPIDIKKASKAFQDEIDYIEGEMLKKQEELAGKDSLEGMVWRK